MHPYRDAKIDADHDSIISLFESLCEIGPCQGYGCEQREHLIRTILHYTSSHFRREERLMRAAGYPDLGEHLLAHAHMQREFQKQLSSMPKTQPNLRADILLLRHMFLLHILTHDDAYGQWLDRRRCLQTMGKMQIRPRGMPLLLVERMSWLHHPARKAKAMVRFKGRPSGLRAWPRLDQGRIARR